LVVSFKDYNIMTLSPELTGTNEAGGSGTDHRHVAGDWWRKLRWWH
jgi:hypothetical protein